MRDAERRRCGPGRGRKKVGNVQRTVDVLPVAGKPARIPGMKRIVEFALLYFGTPLALLYAPALARRWLGVELGMWVIPALVLIATAVVMAEAAHGRLRPAEILYTKDGEYRMIRRAETAEDYFATLVF